MVGNCTSGMMPKMLFTSTKQNSVRMNGTYGWKFFAPMRSRAIVLRPRS